MKPIIYEAANIVNVKLTKSGCIRNAFKALVVAPAYEIDGMVGCMVESKLGISAGLALANSLKNVKYADLDGFMNLTFQPFERGVLYKNGKIVPEKGTGFATLMNF
ncbi:MAG: enolase C-terminal domain-like protein [Nitrososphaeria archaeon]